MPKKVLIFSTAYFPFIGGAEVAVKEITDRIPDVEFDMITARLSRRVKSFERINNVNVYRVGFGSSFDKYFLALAGHLRAEKLHQKNKYDAAWSIMASFGGFAASFFKKNNPAVPFLLTLQEGDDLDYIKKRVGIFYPAFKNIFIRADYIQCISKFLADWARRNNPDCPVEVIPNGVSLGKFDIGAYQEKINGLKRDLGIKEGDITVVTTSRLVVKNGVVDLIESMVSLPDNVKLLVLGSGELENELKNTRQRLNLEKRVIMLGSVPHADIPPYLFISDIFIRASLSEGLGISFLEAMAAGLPIIGTPVGGITDFLIDGETGLFCQPQNAADLADKILKLINNPELRQQIAANGKKMVYRQYSWDLVAEQMKDIFITKLRVRG